MILIWVSTGSVAAGSNSKSGFVVAVVTDISSAVSEDKLTTGCMVTISLVSLMFLQAVG